MNKPTENMYDCEMCVAKDILVQKEENNGRINVSQRVFQLVKNKILETCLVWLIVSCTKKCTVWRVNYQRNANALTLVDRFQYILFSGSLVFKSTILSSSSRGYMNLLGCCTYMENNGWKRLFELFVQLHGSC